MTNKKTIIFQSVESKDFIDALIEDKSRQTGISIMRLIENALIDSFGFENKKLNEWCCSYCLDSPTTSYTSLLPFLPTSSDLFSFYRIICSYHDISLKDGFKAFASLNENDKISDDKAVERCFLSYAKPELTKLFDDFLYENSAFFDENPIPLKQIVSLLLNIYRRDDA